MSGSQYHQFISNRNRIKMKKQIIEEIFTLNKNGKFSN